MYIQKDHITKQGTTIRIWEIMYITIDYLHGNVECDMRGWVNLDGPEKGERPSIRKVIELDKPFPMGMNENAVRAQLSRDKYWDA